MVGFKCPNLKILILTRDDDPYFGRIKSRSFRSVVRNCTKISFLQLAGFQLDRYFFDRLGNMHDLVTLYVSLCRVTDDHCRILVESVPQMRHIGVPGNPDISCVGFKHFARLRFLINLDVYGCSVEPVCLRKIFADLQYFPCLRLITMNPEVYSQVYPGLTREMPAFVPHSPDSF